MLMGLDTPRAGISAIPENVLPPPAEGLNWELLDAFWAEPTPPDDSLTLQSLLCPDFQCFCWHFCELEERITSKIHMNKHENTIQIRKLKSKNCTGNRATRSRQTVHMKSKAINDYQKKPRHWTSHIPLPKSNKRSFTVHILPEKST